MEFCTVTTANLPQTPDLTTANELTNRDAALFYASLGWSVLPLWWIEFDDQLDRYVCACNRSECEQHGSQGKHPWNPSGIKMATQFTPTLERWWSSEPRLGVGIVPKKSGLVVLDRDGWKDAVKASEWGFDLSDAAVQGSGSGNGEHYVWRTSQIGDATPSSGINAVDTKYDGHIVVAPTLHKSGRKYAWQTAQLPGPIPQALLTRLLEPKVTRSTASGTAPDDKMDRDAVAQGNWGEGGAGYDTHRNALIGLIRSHWAQGKLSLDEIKDLAWLAAQRGNTATESDKKWKYEQVTRLVDDTCAKKERGLSDGYQLDVVSPEQLAIARGIAGVGDGDPEVSAEFDRRLSERATQLVLENLARSAAQRYLSGRDARLPETFDDDSLAGVLERPREVEQPVIRGLLGAQHNALLIGRRKTGKTSLALAAAYAAITGQPFLDRETNLTGNVGWWNGEVDEVDFADYALAVGPLEGWGSRLRVQTLRGERLSIMTDEGFDWAVQWLRKRDVQLWVIDSWRVMCTWNGVGQNDNTAGDQLLARLDEVKKEAGVATSLVLAHMGTTEFEVGQERSRGMSCLEDWTDARWVMTLNKTKTRFLSADGRRGIGLDEVELTFESGTFGLGEGSREDSLKIHGAQWVAEIVTAKPGLNAGRVDEQLAQRGVNHKPDQVAARKEAVAQSLVHIKSSGTANLYYPGVDPLKAVAQGLIASSRD